MSFDYQISYKIVDINTATIIKLYEHETNSLVDYAVPQDWLNENRTEYDRRGGAFWVYAKHKDGVLRSTFGRPVYLDQVLSEIGIVVGFGEVKS